MGMNKAYIWLLERFGILSPGKKALGMYLKKGKHMQRYTTQELVDMGEPVFTTSRAGYTEVAKIQMSKQKGGREKSGDLLVIGLWENQEERGIESACIALELSQIQALREALDKAFGNEGNHEDEDL